MKKDKVVEAYLEMMIDGKARGKLADLWTDGKNNFWIPHSQVVSQEHFQDNDFKLTITEFIAIKKGIV